MARPRTKTKTRAPARAKPRLIDGAAMRDVLQAYRGGALDEAATRRRLLKLGVAGNAADSMVRAFRPALGVPARQPGEAL